jgi:2-polyprenyl-3-methyl-5-hydroxy-6-metoxy-1,4-benzoquinol methylase
MTERSSALPQSRATSPGRDLARRLGPGGARVASWLFRLVRRFRPVRERVVIGEFNDHVEREHVARYEFARSFCLGKKVADIACGSGYGSEVLRQTASTVHSYDKELLCGNRTIDLDRESWDEDYDVIVSLETIEHLERPEFFLANVARTAKLLIVSTPIGEIPGYNPHHKQVWTLAEFEALLRRWFEVEFYAQHGDMIRAGADSDAAFVVAVCRPRLAGR